MPHWRSESAPVNRTVSRFTTSQRLRSGFTTLSGSFEGATGISVLSATRCAATRYPLRSYVVSNTPSPSAASCHGAGENEPKADVVMRYSRRAIRS